MGSLLVVLRLRFLYCKLYFFHVWIPSGYEIHDAHQIWMFLVGSGASLKVFILQCLFLDVWILFGCETHDAHLNYYPRQCLYTVLEKLVSCMSIICGGGVECRKNSLLFSMQETTTISTNKWGFLSFFLSFFLFRIDVACSHTREVCHCRNSSIMQRKLIDF